MSEKDQAVNSTEIKQLRVECALGEAPAYIRRVMTWRDKSKEEGTWGSVNVSGMYPYEVIDNLIKHLTVTMLKVRTLKAELAHIKAGESTLKFP